MRLGAFPLILGKKAQISLGHVGGGENLLARQTSNYAAAGAVCDRDFFG